MYNPRDFGARGDGKSLDTQAIQAAIDAAAHQEAGPEKRPVVVLTAGTYLTSSLFLKSHMEFKLEKGAVLLGTVEEDCYPLMRTRVAGIEMEWPVGILNINGQCDVRVTGEGCIDGQGPYWWKKYWGEDGKGGMRKQYDSQGLRWCVDYDCKRVRNLVVMESENVELSGIGSVRSGFWNLHICYSKKIHIHDVWISDNSGPSTDGIDIDSCKDVVVERCRIACNDDSICIKSGRDADGLKVNRICEDVVISDCQILTGCGVTIGSETSGGARNITVRNLKYKNTDCGFRMKSAKTRGGLIENVLVENLEMINVKYPLHLCLNWHPLYSSCRIPEEYGGEIPEHWRVLTTPVPKEQGIPQVKNLTIRNVNSWNEPDYKGISRAFEIDAFPEKPITHMVLDHVNIKAKELGRIAGVRDLQLKEVNIAVENQNEEKNNTFDVR